MALFLPRLFVARRRHLRPRHGAATVALFHAIRRRPLQWRCPGFLCRGVSTPELARQSRTPAPPCHRREPPPARSGRLHGRSQHLPVSVSSDAIHLTADERAMLAGHAGAATQLAMRVLCRMAPLYGAQSLLPVTRAHIDGVILSG